MRHSHRHFVAIAILSAKRKLGGMVKPLRTSRSRLPVS
jgi:hypothetical protein